MSLGYLCVMWVHFFSILFAILPQLLSFYPFPPSTNITTHPFPPVPCQTNDDDQINNSQVLSFIILCEFDARYQFIIGFICHATESYARAYIMSSSRNWNVLAVKRVKLKLRQTAAEAAT